jgi:endogenous inhibitor of DNA gyrase (YacG/DUF329 family)
MKVQCPTCQKTLEWNPQAEFRPFCSKKCQLIDLGDWATESHVISSPMSENPVEAHQIDEEAIAEQFERQSAEFFKH